MLVPVYNNNQKERKKMWARK